MRGVGTIYEYVWTALGAAERGQSHVVLLIVPAHACCSYLRQLDKVKDRRQAHGMPCVPPLAVRPRNFNKDLASKVSVLAKMYASRPNDRTMDKYVRTAGCTSCMRLAPVLYCLDFAL